jgi:Tol biopolymer transport system component/C-terminal processing protease CtpA/Prc
MPSPIRARLTAAALSALVLSAPAAPAHAQGPSTSPDGASWMRYPSISPDGKTIVFTYKGDLYRVASAGGAATLLTSNPAHDFMPVWSHDGKQIAFASDRHGNFDIYVMGANGGEPRRLTFNSAGDYPYAFSADDKQIIFGATRGDEALNREYPTGSQPELYRVPAAGGRVIQMLTTPAEEVTESRDGRYLVYQDKKGGENTWRKHHTSSIARDIWIYDSQTGKHRKITTFAGEDRTPVLTDGDKAIYYLSEESGTFNVHKMSLDGGKSQQLTHFTGVPVRFLSAADNGTLAFGFDGQLYTMTAGSSPKRVNVDLTADTRANVDRILSVNNGARELAVAPSGKEVAFIFRGDVFVAGVDGGGTKRITNTPENETGVAFSPDGKALLYASERGGKWSVYEARRERTPEPYFYASTVVRETPIISNTHQNAEPHYSPNGKQISFTEDRNTLRVYDIATKQSHTVLTDKDIFGDRHTFAWSPDSRWMLFDLDVPGIAPGEVGLVRADGSGEVVNLTESGFNDSRPKWILGGKAMMWLSNRDGLKSVAQSGANQQDVYAMFFDRDAWDKSRLSKDEFALATEIDTLTGRPKPDTSKTRNDTTLKVIDTTTIHRDRPLVLDLDGLENRRARLTIASAPIGDAVLSKDGEMLYYLARFEKGFNLWSTNLRTKETKMALQLNANSASLDWDGKQKTLFLLADGALSTIDPATAKRTTIALAGEESFNAAAEREAMFDHVWRRTRDTFYKQGYHGIDWVGLRPVYAKYLPHIGDNYEFAEMMAEMLGELNISHSGATFSPSSPTDDATAALGAILDPKYTGTGARVEEVLADGPLDHVGMNVKPGTIIQAIDGQTIAADRNIAEFLNRKAGKNVLLTIADNGTTRDIVVKPITSGVENRLLYARWVKRNADEVDRASNHQLGYVHIPGMNDAAYRTTFEDIMGKYALRKGVIIDTRFNTGGDLVADLMMFLSGKKFFDYTTDTRSTGYEPNFRWTKPTVAMANEANYSDGHCFAYSYKAQHIGPLIGMPTPGTCTFSGWESLPDGLRWGVPGVGVKDATTGKFLENSQTTPDIIVMDDYDVVSKGRDQQLEAAIAALTKLVAGEGVKPQ